MSLKEHPNRKSTTLAAYHIARDFVHKMRAEPGKGAPQSITKKEWAPFEDSLKTLPRPWPSAVNNWAMENLEQGMPASSPFRALTEQELRSLTPEAYGQLLEAVHYGMLEPYQAERLIEDAADSGHTVIYPKMMENILAHIWSLNVMPLKDEKMH